MAVPELTYFPAAEAAAPPAEGALPPVGELDLEAIARELDAIGDDVRRDLGSGDAAYIRRVIRAQRVLELAGRSLLLASRGRRTPLVAGTAVLTLAKVLENMEIGHNVMHGQWDWMRDPHINSRVWEWDQASTARSWKQAHNVRHHTFTNIVGLDRDLGYSAMRVDPAQPWHPIHLLQPIYGLLMALTFEWGIAIYDMELDGVGRGEKTREQARAELADFGRKLVRQSLKDYVLFPALSGRHAKRTAAGVFAANVARNVWVHTVVFMGHLPDEAETYGEDQLEGETRGAWYVRQMEGSCNLEGRPLFHLLTGNLSFQVEHHLFPDLPSNRYAQIAPRVRAVCEKHGLKYTTGRLGRQWLQVARKVVRLSVPGGTA